MGHVLPRRTPTGEVLSVASSDSDEFGALTEILARVWTQLVAYLVVALIVLSTSVQLGVLLLVAAPVLVGRVVPAPQAAAPPPGGRARPQLRPHLAGHRHRGGAADPARDRRRAHVRQQLRRPVPARPPGRPVRRHLAGRDRGRRRAVLRRVRGAAGVARHPPGDRRRPDHRSADQLPRLRAVHDLPDPDVLRVRPEAHPRAGLGAEGDRDLRAAAAVDRGDRPAAPARARRPGGRADRVRRPRGPADDRGQRRARGHLRAGRPAGPLPVAGHRAGQPEGGRGPQGPGRAPGPGRARRRPEAAGPARRGARPRGVGRDPRRRWTCPRPGWATYAAASWSATAPASCSPARSRTPSTRTAG